MYRTHLSPTSISENDTDHEDQRPTLAKFFPSQEEFAIRNTFAAVFFANLSAGNNSQAEDINVKVPPRLWELVAHSSELRFVMERTDVVAIRDWSSFNVHLTDVLLTPSRKRGREESKCDGGVNPRMQLATKAAEKQKQRKAVIDAFIQRLQNEDPLRVTITIGSDSDDDDDDQNDEIEV
jgi:hypothetical protein